jgi:hypothetical protein
MREEWSDQGTANVGGIMNSISNDYYYRYARNLETGALWIVAIKPHQDFGDAIARAQFVGRHGGWTSEPVEY